jgi:hypothetical protein
MPKKTTRGIYKSFEFKDHHPVLDAIDRLYELAGVPEGRNGRARLSYVSDKSGVTVGTLINWRTRKTKRPHDAGVEAVIRGLGGERFIKYGEHVLRYGTSSRPVMLTSIQGGKQRRAG